MALSSSARSRAGWRWWKSPARCTRLGRLRIDKLMARHGAELPLPELRALLAGDCPKGRSVSIYDKCRVHFPQLPRLFGIPAERR
jgi:hypothetical protein